MSNIPSSSLIEPRFGWPYYAGWFFFILCLIMPFLSPLVPLFGFNKAITATLMGTFIIGGPELMMIIAIALWGKATFNYFMGELYKLLKHLVSPNAVSSARYYFGLVLLISSFIPSWIIAYVPTLFSNTTRFYILVLFDVVFVLSFFILGGDFWDKVRSLFIPAPIKILQEKHK